MHGCCVICILCATECRFVPVVILFSVANSMRGYLAAVFFHFHVDNNWLWLHTFRVQKSSTRSVLKCWNGHWTMQKSLPYVFIVSLAEYRPSVWSRKGSWCLQSVEQVYVIVILLKPFELSLECKRDVFGYTTVQRLTSFSCVSADLHCVSAEKACFVLTNVWLDCNKFW